MKTSVGTIDSNLECKKTGPLWSEMLIFQSKNKTRSLRPCLQKPFELEWEGFSSSCIYSSYLSNTQGDLACSSEPASAVKPQSRKTKKVRRRDGWNTVHHEGHSESVDSLLLFISDSFFIFLGSHSSPCSHLLYDNPLHPSLQSYNQFNLWPWILQAPLTSKPVASDVENTLIHPYLIVSEIWKVWNKLRAWFTYQCSSDHGQVWLSHPVRVDRYGDIISWVTVSWERADCVQKIKSHNAANYLTAPSPLSAGILIMMSWVITVLGVNFDWKHKTLHHHL